MTGARLAAFAFAGATCLGYPAIAAALWAHLDTTPSHRRLLNMCYPLSQLFLALFALAGGYLYDLSTPVVALVGAINLASLVYDVFLLKRIVRVEHGDVDAYKALLLSEQLEAQRRHAEERDGEAARAKSVNDGMVAGLEDIRALLDAGDAQAVQEWLDQAAESLEATDARYCENLALDALLAAKARRCEKLGVPFECNVAVPAQLDVPDAEVCALFANLIDNAVNATEELRGADAAAQPSVKVDALVAGGYLSVRVLNACPRRERRGKSRPATRLSGRGINAEHGWGKSIIAIIAQRHDGDFTTTVEDGTHAAKVTLRVR